jgi:CTP:phosphocholine cytidylyltransferase-like protein
MITMKSKNNVLIIGFCKKNSFFYLKQIYSKSQIQNSSFNSLNSHLTSLSAKATPKKTKS